MIEGCLQWQQHGLAPPTVVTAATAAYLEAEDAIAAWIADCCEIDPNHWERRNDLFASWSAWTQKTGEYTGSQKRFLERLETRPGDNTEAPQPRSGFLWAAAAIRHNG